jgi:hypothetical protein
MVRVNGSFFDDPPSIWRADPGPEADRAWDKLTWQNVFAISKEEAAKITGGDLSSTVRVPENWGYGTDMRLAKLDLGHQLHCLNVIRKGLSPEYYMKDEIRGRLYWGHLKHCLHIVLQQILCTANTDLILYNWQETQRWPVPNFSFERKCRDHKTILDWAEKQAIPFTKERWDELLPTEDTKFTPVSERLWWYFHEKAPEGRGNWHQEIR